MPARILASLLALGLFPRFAISQESTPVPPPTPPWVAEVPENSTFTIAITYSDTPAQPEGNAPEKTSTSDRPVKVQVWRGSQARRILVHHANGETSEGFLFDSKFAIRSTANSQKTFVSQSGTGRDASLDMFTTAFQGTQWIAQSYYRAAEKTDAGYVYLYEQPASAPPTAPTNSGGPPPGFRALDHMQLKAAIRADTKTPVTVQLGPATYTFSAIEPWDGKIEMPQNFKSSAQGFSKELKVLDALRKKKN